MKVIKSPRKRWSEMEGQASDSSNEASAGQSGEYISPACEESVIKKQVSEAPGFSDSEEQEGDESLVSIEDFAADFEQPVYSRTPSKKKRSSRNPATSSTRRRTSVNKLENEIEPSVGERSVDGFRSSEDETKSEYKRLMHKAIHLLSMREHSVQELDAKLQAKTENHEVVYSVMEFLRANDYVSDIRFTEAFVRARANKGHGPVKIKADLRQKGVKSVLIEEHLDANAALWFDNAKELHNKKYGDTPVSDYNTWSKRARFLQSRGFTMDHIHSTVPQVDYD